MVKDTVGLLCTLIEHKFYQLCFLLAIVLGAESTKMNEINSFPYSKPGLEFKERENWKEFGCR